MSLLSEGVRSRLIEVYTGPDRHYHDLRHIETLLALAQEHASEITDNEVFEAAIWFHDAVYDTRKADNETQSAKLATELLAGATTDERLKLISVMIRASANHRVPEAMDATAAHDCALFLDMDLSIFGGPAEEFAAYERAVRLEYDWVAEEEWVTARSEVLRSFLVRPTIYASPQFRGSHEAAARSNLKRSLESLDARGCRSTASRSLSIVPLDSYRTCCGAEIVGPVPKADTFCEAPRACSLSDPKRTLCAPFVPRITGVCASARGSRGSPAAPCALSSECAEPPPPCAQGAAPPPRSRTWR
jgi:predicted metal-dependent HD superfamily phosphohydrolase